MKLFDDNETDNDDISKIEVNEEYARRFEHNKKREELQRFEELKRRGEIEESDSKSYFESSDEEDDAEIDKLSKKEDIKKLFENLIKVKDHHPSVYQPVNLFESESESESENESDRDVKEENEDRRKKPKYLKDVVAQHLIEEGPEFDDAESNKKKKTYNEEQEELKKAFLDEVKNLEEDGDDLLKVKEKKDDNEGQDDDEEFQKKLGEYFGPDDALDENSKFLKDYFEKQMWIDRENKNHIDEGEVDVVSDEDEEYWEQEDYERDYNFRYEENAGDRVMGHSRIVEGSVRKEKNSRKEQRKNKMERMKVAEMERKEELKHLKNLKKKEMKEKLKKVMEVAGVTDGNDFGLDLDDLEEEFDPAVYDSKMNKAFGDKYYHANDADPDFGSDEDGDIEKPDFDKEDELLGLPKGWDAVGNDDGFTAARKRALEKIPEDNVHNIEEEEEEDDDDEDEDEESNTDSEDSNDGEETKEEERETEVAKDEEITKKRKRKEKVSLVQRAKEAMLDEYYKLDYEDTIGDLKTRFKYAKVKPNRYGLKTEELLLLDDKDLNQYVSVKKIAPYREDEWKVPSNKKWEYKEKARELLRGKQNHGASSKKKSLDKDDKSKAVSDQEKKQESEGTNVEEANLSRNKKRKLRQKELKLSGSRMAAYQNLQQKASGKRKR